MRSATGRRRHAHRLATAGAGLLPGLALLGALSIPSAASAAFTCGPNQAITGQTIHGPVVVIGACQLDHVVVDGDILLLPARPGSAAGQLTLLGGDTINGRITLGSGSRIFSGASGNVIRGALTATNAYVDLEGVAVYGPTTIDGGAPPSTAIVANNNLRGGLTVERQPGGSNSAFSVSGNTVTGFIRLLDNAAPLLVVDNHVRGDITVNGNSGGTSGGYPGGGISLNTASGSLSCAGNATPFDGGGNLALLKTGQCASL